MQTEIPGSKLAVRGTTGADSTRLAEAAQARRELESGREAFPTTRCVPVIQ